MTREAGMSNSPDYGKAQELDRREHGRDEAGVLPSAVHRVRYADVLGVRVDAVGMRTALERIEGALANQQKGYICMAGVHGIMEAQRNAATREALDQSLMTLPDGMPIVWVGRSQGLNWMERVTGPDLMLEVFRSREFSRYTHFFYGGKPGVARELGARLSKRFPWARVVGTYTPPFRMLTADEESAFISTIDRLRPSIIWVGISTPRQEMFMQKSLPLLDTNLMFGVGAAFDFHTGRIRDCSDWIKRAGLQWLHRLLQDPRHLLWRYLRNNSAFLWRMGLQAAGYGRQRQSVFGPGANRESHDPMLHPACIPAENGSD